MAQLQEWKNSLQIRRTMRERYFKTGSPDAVKKLILEDLLSFVIKPNRDNIEQLVNMTYHPKGKENPSWGNNPYFEALLQITDQLFIYQEFLQEMISNLNHEIDDIVPAKRRTREIKEMSPDKSELHLALQNARKSGKSLLNSPNKMDLYNLIDDKKTISKLWEEFNKLRGEKDKVSKQYISQIIKELENQNLIIVQRQGKSKIPRKFDF